MSGRKKLRYFLPDSQDLVDPSFDFDREIRSPDRVRHRDDHYAHEVFGSRAFDGILVSKAIVDGVGGGGQARYTQAQKRRLLRDGVREFFRTKDHPWGPLSFIGDCGAFSYVKEEKPPYTVDEVLEFYHSCGFDYGISVDHIILPYEPDWDVKMYGEDAVPAEMRQRQEITIELASAFFKANKKSGSRMTPMGVAQGWSPKSYARSVKQLQKIGYTYIAIGGVVPLKTPEILAVLDEIAGIRKDTTEFHMLGVTRLEAIRTFRSHGVISFDSTSPLRQAFMDATDNYYTLDRTYTAVRVPQVQGNPKLAKRIQAGEVDNDTARKAERKALEYLDEYARRKRQLPSVLQALNAYSSLHSPDLKKPSNDREVLEARPWEACGCEVCKQLGHHVVLFRGAERNRRRGFHNVQVFYQRLAAEVASRGSGSKAAAPHAKVARRAVPMQQAFSL